MMESMQEGAHRGGRGGGLPLAVLAALGNELAAVEASDHGGLTGRLVEPLALVVVDERDQLTSGGALLHGAGVKTAGGGHLLEREHALLAQAAEAALEAVLLANVGDDDGAEPIRHAGTQASGIEDLSDLHVGVFVDQAIDVGDHRRVGLAQLWS